MATPNLRELVESTGVKIDDNFYNPNNPNYESNQQLLREATNALYGNVGANLDARNWDAIMESGNPLQAAKEGLKDMYSDPEYLVANAEQLLQKGYAPEQADLTYQQMQDRVGATYNPNWAAGSRFEGGINTDAYLENIGKLKGEALTEYENSLLVKWGGTPRAKSSAGLADMENSANSVFSANAATNANAFTPTNTATTTGKTTGSPTTGTGLITGNASGSITGSPTTGTGLISGADNLSGSRAMTPAQTGSAGLVTSNMLTTPKTAGVTLPTGATPTATWNFGTPQAAGAPQVKAGVVSWRNPATGQRVTYPAGTAAPGPEWVMG